MIIIIIIINQVMVPAEDRDDLRFLWYADDYMTQYRMATHLFGGIRTSSVASCYSELIP